MTLYTLPKFYLLTRETENLGGYAGYVTQPRGGC